MRQASVQIGGAVYDMDDFYFEFEVPFEDTTTVQTATVKIYNLAKATRAGHRAQSTDDHQCRI